MVPFVFLGLRVPVGVSGLVPLVFLRVRMKVSRLVPLVFLACGCG